MRKLLLALFLVTDAALAASIGGRANPGATVTADSDVLATPRVTRTAANGAYAIEGLPAGAYDVSFALPKHQTLTRHAIVRAGERTRVDAQLEPSEEEESVTSTGGARSVLERPQHAWTLDAATAEHLPLGRAIGNDLELAPGLPPARAFVGQELFGARIAQMPLEAVTDTSVIFAAPSAELGWSTTSIALLGTATARTPRASIRETIEFHDGERTHVHEASGGGLGMFLAAAAGDDRRSSAFATGSFAPTARDALSLSILAVRDQQEQLGATWLHSDALFTTMATHATGYSALRGFAFARGAHELAAGVERFDDDYAAYVRDRFQITDRFIFEGGLRYEDDELAPRAGAVFDAGGDTRVAATYARDEFSLAVGRPFGAAGYGRITLVERENADAILVDGEFQWLLFTIGGTGTFLRDFTSANLWLHVDPPLPGHDVNVALLQRYRQGASFTDLALNYALPRERFTAFVHLDVVNVFREPVYRVGLGARL